MARAQLVFAAQTLIEYQARQALQAGAEQIFVMVDAVTPTMSRLVDRMAAEGAQLYLVRDMGGLIRQLPRESDVLLFADGMIADQRYIAELAGGEGNALLVVADEAMTAHLERVDAVHRWAGVARVSPRTLFNTLDLIGDWDLVLTLLRAVVQNDPRRVVVSSADVAEGRVAMIDSQAAADLASRSLGTPRGGVQRGAGAERYLFAPVARFAASRLMRMQIAAGHIGWIAAGLALLGLLCVLPGWGFLSLLLFAAALIGEGVAQQVADMGRHGPANLVAELAPTIIIATGIAWLGAHYDATSDALHLALLSVVTVFAVRSDKDITAPPWALMTPGSAVLLLLLGMVIGRMAVVMAVGALLAIASLAVMLLLQASPGRARKPR